MARLITTGFEGRDPSNIGIDFANSSSSAITAETTTVRSGSASAKCDSGAGNTSAYGNSAITGVLGRRYFARAYIYLPANPTSSVAIMVLGVLVTSGAMVRLNANGTLTLGYGDATTPASMTIVGASSSALSLNTWIRLELSCLVDTGTIDTCEMLVDGVSIASGSALAITDTALSRATVAFVTGPGASKVIYFDDWAVNDDQGANQNTWPGDGKIVLLLPTADSAIGTGWTLGTGTAISGNSGSTAVKNTPPVGVADLAAGSDVKQIRNASANANVSYDATMTTYSAAGVGAGDTINVVDPITVTAAPVTTSSKQGTVGVVSNPAITNVALAAGGTAGAFWSGATAGTYATGWKLSHGTLTYAPSVTVGTAPVMRVTQVTSSTRIAMVCFMGMYVDYTPAAATFLPYRNPMPPLIAQ